MKIEINQVKESEQIKNKNEQQEKKSNDIDFRDFLGYIPQQSISFMNPVSGFDMNDFISDDEIDGIKSSYTYDILRMDRDDALFFAHAVKGEKIACNMNGEVFLHNNINLNSTKEMEQMYKSSPVSKTLMNMLSESMNHNKAVRIDFGNDISAVIKVDREGRIAAEFIPSDKAAEEFLKNNISYLKETFERESIEYNELSYRNHKRQNKNNNKGNKGE